MKDMREYLSWLEKRGELIRVEEELSPELEIPAFLRRVMYSKAGAVLFERVKGYPEWRIAGNLFTGVETLKDALGVERLEEIGERPLKLFEGLPLGFSDKLSSLGRLKEMSAYLPKVVRKAEFTKNVIEDNPLDFIPAFKTWPRDAGRYLTYPLVCFSDPKEVNSISVYRVMLLDGERAVLHWQIHKRGSQAWRDYIEKNGGKMPVAIAIGSDIGTLLTAVSPVPYPLDKLLFAGFVRGKGLELYRLPNGVLVPANAEAVIEGYVDVKELHEEGPFGDHFGFYDKPAERNELYPVFHAERVYYRDDPIYYGSVVGKPPLEDAVIGKAIERIFLPMMKMILPEVVDVNFPEYGVFQGIAIVSIKKRYPGHGKKVLNALWGTGQAALTKVIVVVSEDINPHDINQVIWAIASFVDPQRDVLVIPNAHTDALDPAVPNPPLGSKLGIDATRKLPEEMNGRVVEEVEEDPQVLKRLEGLFKKYLGE
ncbi:menaquinone biosynthesis decarboxylase [Thermococcus profundus]|uniref:Menaquinone biosynthesis decarboxylase n=1 Tax=Thermococcus profundus TaxID=49899 RepID=A0A2Z2MJ90_THEPR|nr:UbiD family decarboxylase [Thermococcus profundus]ASJ02018.1 menaquinone biosynthesis decarboxylase [Thermococcus profundus]